MRYETKSKLLTGIVFGCLFVAGGVAVTLLNSFTPEARAITPDKTNQYLVTPSGETHVYKFYDEVGAICFVAEGQRGANSAVSIYCIPGSEGEPVESAMEKVQELPL